MGVGILKSQKSPELHVTIVFESWKHTQHARRIWSWAGYPQDIRFFALCVQERIELWQVHERDALDVLSAAAMSNYGTAGN